MSSPNASCRKAERFAVSMADFQSVGIAALPQMVAASLREPIHFALTYDEEVGCLGGAQIVKEIAGLGLAPRAAIVGEPTSMRVITGHKSMNVVAVTFHGVAAHSSLTPSGVNAIEYAASFVRFVREQAQEWREHGPFDDPDSLNRVNLLHLHDRHWSADAIGWQPLGWAEWFRANGAEWAKAPASLSTNKVSLLIEATLAGQGVMLGWHHMIEALIRQGTLVFAHPAPITAGRGNFLNCRQKSMERQSVAAFVAHVLGAVKGAEG